MLEANPKHPDLLQGTTQVRTKLAEVQGGPVKSKGTGRRQRPNTDSAVRIQTPQSITTGSQLSQLHLNTQKEGRRYRNLLNKCRPAQRELRKWVFTSGGRGTEEGLS